MSGLRLGVTLKGDLREPLKFLRSSLCGSSVESEVPSSLPQSPSTLALIPPAHSLKQRYPTSTPEGTEWRRNTCNNSHRDVRYSTGKTVKSIAVTVVVPGGYQTYWGDHFLRYVNV